MHVIIVRWKIKAGFENEFETVMRDHIRATKRTEPGCVMFEVAVDKADPRTYHLYEVYADDQALTDHAKSPTLANLRAKAPEWVEDRSYHTGMRWPDITA